MDAVLPSGAAQLGAYGLRLTGVDAPHLLVPAEDGWPTIRLLSRVTEVDDAPEHVTDTHARLRLRTGGRIVLDRAAGTARFDVRRPLGDEELVHPYLAPVAALMAHWLGREGFHAGGIAVGGDVWGLVGDRLSGKSTLLAALAATGQHVVADDLLVFDSASGRVFAGPRSIDLREEAAARLGVGATIGVAGTRERWRVPTGDVPRALTLRGWIFLSWGDELSLDEVRAPRRLELLAAQRAVTLAPRSPSSLLDAAALPSVELRRPRDWDALDDAVERLVRRLTS